MSRSSSAVVDSKVVEMSLENTNFERNAATSLSTIQKLKEALNFTTSKDGLDNFNSSLKKVDFNPMAAGINTARQGISALDAVSFGFFSRIGSQIEQTTMQYAKMFTSKPIEDGFKEYELKMGSVQTILMGAKTKEGLPVTLDMVNQKLDELNAYADKTIYSFSDMTSNIGKFTNAGVDLDTAVAAIQGISNEAALAGANSQQASHAMYNFAQALSSGYVKLIDWKSIENANMATVDFKQTLIDTAVELGTVTKVGEEYQSVTTDMNGHVSELFDATKMFNDSLSAQWMTSDVLTTALGKYADETTELGQKASKAATEVKTFTQLIDTLQEAAGSGWAQTWELLIGDFDQSKKLFTMLSDTFGGIIDAQAKARNNLLKEGLGKPTEAVTAEYWKNLDLSTRQTKLLYKELMEVGKANGVAFESDNFVGFMNSLKEGWLSTDMLADAVKRLNSEGVDGDGMSKSLDEINEAADRVIKGDFGNDMPERIAQLNEEGFDGEKVQAYVNELYKLAGNTWNITDAIREQAAANVGLEESMKGTSGEFDNIIDKVDSKSLKKSGRELLFDSIVTSIFAFKKIAGSIKGAWDDVFPPATGDMIYNIARAINDASKALRRFALKNAENIGNAFRGIFSVFSLLLSVGKRLLGTVFKGLGVIFNALAGPIGGFITKLGNLLTMLNDWAVQNQIVERTFGAIETGVGVVTGKIKGWFDAFKALPGVQRVLNSFGDAFSYIYDNFPNILDNVGKSFGTFKDRVVNAFSNTKSPEEFFKGIKLAFQGLWKDISASTLVKNFKGSFKTLGTTIKDFFTGLGKKEDGTKNTFGKLSDSATRFKDDMTLAFEGIDEEGNKIDIFSGIKKAFSNLKENISLSGIGEKIKNGLDTIKTTVSNFFLNLGKNADGSLNTFGKIWTGLLLKIQAVKDKLRAIKNGVHDFFEEHKIGKFLVDIFTTLGTAIGSFFKSIPAFVEGAKAKFGEFIEKVKSLGGLKFENLGEIWKAFKDTVVKYFRDSKIFEPIVTAFTTIKEKVKEKLAELGVNVGEIKNRIVAFFKGIKNAVTGFSFPEAFQKIIDFFTKKKEGVKNGSKTLGSVLFGFFKKLAKFVTGIKPEQILGIVAALLAFKGLKFIGTLVKPIEQLISAMAAEHKSKANFLNKAALLEMAGAFVLFAVTLKILAGIKVGDIIKGVATIGAMMLLITSFAKSMDKLDPKKMIAASALMSSMAGSMILAIIAIVLIGKVVLNDLPTAIAGLIGAGVLFAALVKMMKVMQKVSGGTEGLAAAKSMMSVIISLYALLGLIMLLSFLPFGRILNGLVKLVPIVFALWAIMKAMKKAVGEDGLSISIGIAGLAACILAIGAALWIISKIKPGTLLKSVLALGVIMLALAVVVKSAKGIEKGLGTMVGLAAVILAIAASLAILSLIKPTALIAPVAAISAILLMLTVLAGVTGKVKPALTSLLMMTVLIAAIGTVLFLLATLPNPETVAQIAAGLGLIFAGLGVAMYGAVAAGTAAGPALLGLVVMAAFIAAFTLLAWAIGALGGDQMSTIQTGLDIIKMVLGGLGEAVGAFFAGIGTELFDALPQIGQDITDFMSNLSGLNEIGMVDIGPLAEALGAILGVSAVGFADSLMSIVSEIEEGKSSAQMLADDMVALSSAFVEYQTAMDSVDGIEIDTQPLMDAIGAVVAASIGGFIDGLTSIVTEMVTGKTAVQMVADDMTALAEGFTNYATAMASFEGIEIDTQPLMDAIGAVTAASLSGLVDGLTSQLTEAWTGKAAVALAAEDMSTLATGFTDYATAMSEFDGIEIDTTALDDIIDIIGQISLQGLLTSLGSLILGEDDKTQVTQFAEDMGTLSTALVDWQTDMAPLDGLTVPTDDIAKLKEALDTIKEGGIIDSMLNFFGVDTTPDYSSFTTGITGLGGAINDFANSLGEDFDSEKMTVATDAIKKLAEVGVALGDVDFGGWFHDGVLTNFAQELVDIVPNLNSFSTSFTDVESFSSVALAVKQLASGASLLANVKFGEGDLTNDDIVSKVKANIDTVRSMIEGLADIDTSGVDKFTGALSKINSADLSKASQNLSNTDAGSDTGKDITSNITSNIDSSSISSGVSSALSSALGSVDTSGFGAIGTSMTAKIGLAIINGAGSIKSSLKAALDSALSAAEGYKSSFTSAGWNFSSGLGQGIRLNKYSAINAAIEVAKAALEATKRTLDSHSPSRETEKLGRFFDLGLVKGIGGYSSVVSNAASNVANMALDGVRRAVAATNDILAGTGNEQPIITPILDLSQVRDGASRIASLMPTSPTLLSNFSAIGENAEAIRERNSNADILNALGKLGDNLSSDRPGDTYNINGVTYDDGSNIASAVGELIRAARVERRA